MIVTEDVKENAWGLSNIPVFSLRNWEKSWKTCQGMYLEPPKYEDC
jgi:hypothetical protein